MCPCNIIRKKVSPQKSVKTETIEYLELVHRKITLSFTE